MSGPIRPPLRVRDTDSSPNVVPVNTIVVSDGDLVDDGGATVTIDTSGSGMVSFDVDGDTGSAQTITNGNTLTIKNAAGGAIKTVAQATDELTIDLTVSGVTAASYTNTDLTVDAQGRITAASSGSSGTSFPLEAPDGSALAPSYSFSSQTGTGSYYHSTNKIGWATGGGLRMTLDNNHHLKEINRIVNDGGSWSYPSYTFDGDEDTGMGREDTNAIFFGTGGSARLTIGSDGTVDFINSKIEIDGDIGDDGQVLTSTGSAVAWEDVPGGDNDFDVQLGRANSITGIYTIDNLAAIPPWGNNEVTSGVIRNQVQIYPFIAATTGTVDGIVFDVDTAASSAVDIYVGIYTDNGGLPQTLIASATFDGETGGQQTQTSLSASLATTRGTQYWAGVVRSVVPSGVLHGTAATIYNPWIGPTNSLSSALDLYAIESGVSDYALPASIDAEDLEPSPYYRFAVGLTY